ncbi:DUF938 domain-containing protein [Endozoicomonas numazuensis]|uniref:Methylase n=1 Tax=Endozoicomonas numazuensis TaxID=1137799 RepID=A0A081NCR5_9GAMM|nr:DUF938 domain-containing protein [Endozoicomonas numazuensis]KEQ16238.1 methylase [Endozoicomonas numazuensis]
MSLPFSEACEKNKQPILEVIRPLFEKAVSVVEIGSGTGQHAEFFASSMPAIHWQPTDRAEHLAVIEARRQASGLSNYFPPLELDVNSDWPIQQADNIFTANTLHIMSWKEVEKLFAGIGRVLLDGGLVCLYGPFNYQGQYSSESNARFDEWLKQQDPNSAIRDFEAIERLAGRVGLSLLQDIAMPANNRCLVFKKPVR